MFLVSTLDGALEVDEGSCVDPAVVQDLHEVIVTEAVLITLFFFRGFAHRDFELCLIEASVAFGKDDFFIIEFLVDVGLGVASANLLLGARGLILVGTHGLWIRLISLVKQLFSCFFSCHVIVFVVSLIKL